MAFEVSGTRYYHRLTGPDGSAYLNEEGYHVYRNYRIPRNCGATVVSGTETTVTSPLAIAATSCRNIYGACVIARYATCPMRYVLAYYTARKIDGLRELQICG